MQSRISPSLSRIRRGDKTCAGSAEVKARQAIAVTLFLALGACGGGGSGGGPNPSDPIAGPAPMQPIAPPPTPSPTPDPEPAPEPSPEPPSAPPPAEFLAVFEDPFSTSRFLSIATFGATMSDIQRLSGTSAERWFMEQLTIDATLIRPVFDEYVNRIDEDTFLPFSPNTMGFWRHAVSAPDQLRQRMVFALSQILVASDFGGELLTDVPSGINYYIDVLTRNAFGNYRELLEEITYSPAMGHYLTYAGNLPADDSTGRMPDENYAREILQLFSIGLLELNSDGTLRTGSDGAPIETYDNQDITGLARVFTGLNFGADPDEVDDDGDLISLALSRPMTLFEDQHSPREKSFLGLTIPAGTPGTDSVAMALDHIMTHPNVGPFIGRQLIQRFTSSAPSSRYVQEVATAFDTGRYVLPDNTVVGDGRKGDLSATLAAVLFSPEAHGLAVEESTTFGKPREPILRLTQWMRAFEVDASQPELVPALYDLLPNELLGQHPYRSRSVFNFYRPGYLAPGSISGGAGLTVPELQIVNASTNPGYVNVMNFFIFGVQAEGEEIEELREVFEEVNLFLDEEAARRAFVADYRRESDLADSPTELVSHLDLLLAAGQLQQGTKDAIVELIGRIAPSSSIDDEERMLRVTFAVLMLMSAPEYLVQK
ncbi:MAG: DUF1800 family protein [Pseudomonadota bacterium]